MTEEETVALIKKNLDLVVGYASNDPEDSTRTVFLYWEDEEIARADL